MKTIINRINLPDTNFDTFIQGLHRAIKYYDREIPTWQLYGISGMGARITLSMNVRTNVEIGHPSSNYIWDVVSTMENCLSFLKYKLYIGNGYAGSARETAAKTERVLKDNVIIIENNLLVKGPLIFADKSGEWLYSENGVELICENELPFGPIAIQITGIGNYIFEFPRKTLLYLINTLERGEEPMEMVGRGNYSAVSGWKAYARWMQSFSIPLKNIIHPYQKEIAKLVLERRSYFTYYLFKLAEIVSETERELIIELAERYYSVILPLEEIVKKGATFKLVKNVYFLEQMTLPTYKSIRNYMKQRVKKRKN